MGCVCGLGKEEKKSRGVNVGGSGGWRKGVVELLRINNHENTQLQNINSHFIQPPIEFN